MQAYKWCQDIHQSNQPLAILKAKMKKQIFDLDLLTSF